MAKIPANFPPPNVPLVNAAGLMNTTWRTALVVPLYQRTGGADGSSADDLAAQVNQLDNVATSASETAQLAFNDSQSALSQINTLTATVNGVSSVANSASSTAENLFSNTLIKSNNLSDVASIPTAQTNLSVNITPVGATSRRPKNPSNGQTYFDTTIVQAIWYIGGTWTNATGMVV